MQTFNAPDRQAQLVWLILSILGMVVAIATWLRLIGW